MSTATPATADRRRRPKDRKEQIARASAEAFSELGYHGVSMEDIAGRVGVTAASLYRHYTGKYDLFRAAVLGLGEQLTELTAFLDDDGLLDADVIAADVAWDRTVATLTDAALKYRTSGGLYRWEHRYLGPADQRLLETQLARVNRRVQRPVSVIRPDLSRADRTILSAAVLSVVGSITDHHARLATDRIHATMVRITRDLRDTTLPVLTASAAEPRRRTVGAAAGEYEQILRAALLLFNERGYRDTGLDDIAAAVDISPPTIYRFFPSKGAILAALFRRGADRVSSDVSDVLAIADDPRAAIGGLVETYVQRSMTNPELAYVYYAERASLPAEDRVVIHNIQRATVEAWSSQVAAANAEFGPDEARFAVQAAFSLAVDVGRVVQGEDVAWVRAILDHLMMTVLLGNRH